MANDVKFTALEEILLRVKDGDTAGAGALLKAFSDDLSRYEEAIRLVLDGQAKAVDNLIVASKKTSKMLRAVTPDTTGLEEEASKRWLERFNEMCSELGTDIFMQVDEGLVYMENKSIMFKGDTLVAYMKTHYGKLPKRHHFDVAKVLLGAESSSVSRQHFRSRVWVVKSKDAQKTTNENF